MNLYSQEFSHIESINPFCSIEKGNYLLSLQEVIDFEYPLNEEERKTFNSLRVEMTIDYGIFTENDTIKFAYINFRMATIGLNPLYKKWNSHNSDKLLHINFDNGLTLEFENPTQICKFEMAPLNKTFSDILAKYKITKDDLHKLTTYEITSIEIQDQEENVLMELDVPEMKAINFKKSMIELFEKFKKEEITFANKVYK